MPLALRVVLVLALLPLATGSLVVTYGDTLFHLPTRAVVAFDLRTGHLPLVHPGASCGEPLAGHPHYGVFFPDTLLAVLLPVPVAFGLRFALSLALAFLGARRWARAEGASRAAADVAGLAFALSGVFFSAWRFFSSGLALAIAPFVLAGAAKIARRAASSEDTRSMRRGVGELGLWTALELLAGEPVVALLAVTLAGARLTWGGRRAIVPAVAAGVLAALIAAPQIAATSQVLADSTREAGRIPFAVATRTSVHPIRFLEQLLPFPYGRPDRRDAGGFVGHPSFDRGTPYLWTLHLGLPVLGLLLLHTRVRSRTEGPYAAAAALAAILSLGRYLPGASALYPLLSLGGRIRFPVKWWYAVALLLVPLVGVAAGRWLAGERAGTARRVLLGAWCLATLAVLVVHQPSWPLATGPLLSVAVTLSLLAERRRTGALAASIAVSLVTCAAPLLLAVVDVPPETPPRLVIGRLYARLRTDVHPNPPSPDARPALVREFFRRASRELWPLTGTRAGIGYAFDFDPDGSYASSDRAMHKAIEVQEWPDRVPLLRSSGVSAVVTDVALPPPYREMTVLNAGEGVRLYTLDGAAPSLRLATRIHRAPDIDGLVSAHADPSFRLETDVVLEGPWSRAEAAAVAGTVVVVHERADSVGAEISAPVDGVAVWSRTFFSAWTATLDGRPVRPVRADGHLVGVPVTAGRHDLEIRWNPTPVAAGLAAAAVGFVLLAVLYRRR